MKYESNTPMVSKDVAWKPFCVRTCVQTYICTSVRTYVCTDKGDAISPPLKMARA